MTNKICLTLWNQDVLVALITREDVMQKKKKLKKIKEYQFSWVTGEGLKI